MLVTMVTTRRITSFVAVVSLLATASGAALAIHQVECTDHQEDHNPDGCQICDTIHAPFENLVSPAAVAALIEPPDPRLTIGQQVDPIAIDQRAPAAPRAPPFDASCLA